MFGNFFGFGSGGAGGGGGSGTVTSFDFIDANGFSGSVATATTTPQLTLSVSTTENFLIKTGGSGDITESLVFDDGTNVSIGTITGFARLGVVGIGQTGGTFSFKAVNTNNDSAFAVRDDLAVLINGAGGLILGDGSHSMIFLDNVDTGNQLALRSASGSFNNVSIQLGATGQGSELVTNSGTWIMNSNLRLDSTGQSILYVNNGGNGLRLSGEATGTAHLTIADTGLVTIFNLKYDNGSQSNGYVLTSDASGNATWAPNAGGGGVTGSGTTNFLPKWSSSTALTNSLVFDDGTNVGVGISSGLTARLQVKGAGNTSATYAAKLDSSTAQVAYFRNDGLVTFGTDFSWAPATGLTILKHLSVGGSASASAANGLSILETTTQAPYNAIRTTINSTGVASAVRGFLNEISNKQTSSTNPALLGISTQSTFASALNVSTQNFVGIDISMITDAAQTGTVEDSIALYLRSATWLGAVPATSYGIYIEDQNAGSPDSAAIAILSQTNNKGVVSLADLAVVDDALGLVLLSSVDGHYYRYKAGVAGALVITDLGTTY